jgi:hypothetical protein
LTEAVTARRTFLTTLLSAGLCILGKPPLVRASPSHAPQHNTLGLRLADLFTQRASVEVIGLEYLRSARQEQDSTTLSNLISSGCGHALGPHLADADLRECMRRRVRQDFAEGHILTMHGWVVSLTEARLCALVTLVFTSTTQRPLA